MPPAGDCLLTRSWGEPSDSQTITVKESQEVTVKQVGQSITVSHRQTVNQNLTESQAVQPAQTDNAVTWWVSHN